MNTKTYLVKMTVILTIQDHIGIEEVLRNTSVVNTYIVLPMDVRSISIKEVIEDV